MTDPTHDPPLVERLRSTADYLEAIGPVTLPADLKPLPKQAAYLAEPAPAHAHNLADLHREAARALEEMEGSIALSHRQTGALAAVKSAEETREVLLAILGPDHEQDRDLPLSMLAKVAAQVMGMRGAPPNRAPLLAALEGRITAGATTAPETVEVIRDAIAALRTDARVIEASRGALKSWHGWARKLAGCSDGTDEELRGYIARLVGRLHALRAQDLAKLDSPQ